MYITFLWKTLFKEWCIKSYIYSSKEENDLLLDSIWRSHTSLMIYALKIRILHHFTYYLYPFRYGLIGANGSGKSSLLAVLGNREVPIQEHIGKSIFYFEISPLGGYDISTVDDFYYRTFKGPLLRILSISFSAYKVKCAQKE